MMRFTRLTSRNLLIAIHDALATTFALFASFYLRFEGSDAFFARLPLLLRVLPYFVIFSVVVCYFFKLTTTKWRFISLPDALNIVRAASVLTLALVVLDYFSIFFSRFSSSARCVSPTAISAIRACGTMPEAKARRRRCWWGGPPTRKSCC